MGVNDLLGPRRRALYFLDYLAMHRVDPARVEAIVAGIAAGCAQAGAALVGGETAEMPDFYAPGEYDLAGFAVGVVERSRIVTGAAARAGGSRVGLGLLGAPLAMAYSLACRAAFSNGSALAVGDAFPAPSAAWPTSC